MLNSAHSGVWDHFQEKHDEVRHLIESIYEKAGRLGETVYEQRNELENMVHEFEQHLFHTYEQTQDVIGDCADMNRAADHVFENMMNMFGESAGALEAAEHHAERALEEAVNGLHRNEEHVWNALLMHEEISVSQVDHIFNRGMDLVDGFHDAIDGMEMLEAIEEADIPCMDEIEELFEEMHE